MQKPRLLWIAVKLFDKSVDKATWLEPMKTLCKEFDVFFLTAWRDTPSEIKICGRSAHYFPQYGKGLVQKITRKLLMANAVKKKIARIRPDLIILNCNTDMKVSKSVLSSARPLKAPTVLDIRTLPTHLSEAKSWGPFGKNLHFACQNFSGVTYITEEMRRYCIKRYLLPTHKTAVWTSGVDADMFRPAVSKPAGTPFRLIYHGGIISVSRGLDRLIQVMDHVKDLDICLTLISSLREPEATCWIERLNLQDRVTLVDTIAHAQIPAQLQAHHAGILPFPSCDIWNTSSPIKLFEYMACGLPVIATEIPAHRNVLNGKPFAFFAKDASPQALAEAIRQAYAQKNRFEELGQQARAQVLEEHTWDRQANKLGSFLKSFL